MVNQVAPRHRSGDRWRGRRHRTRDTIRPDDTGPPSEHGDSPDTDRPLDPEHVLHSSTDGVCDAEVDCLLRANQASSDTRSDTEAITDRDTGIVSNPHTGRTSGCDAAHVPGPDTERVSGPDGEHLTGSNT